MQTGITDEQIRSQIPFALESTDFPSLGSRYQGKVRDSYVKGDRRVLIASDRISAFDRVLTTIPFKGEVLTRLASFWFGLTSEIIANHVVSEPDPQVIVGRELKIVPIEVVMRGYLTGSAWRDYEKGNDISGIKLPKNLRKNQKFPEPIITPSTKESAGHDQPISREEILKRKIVSEELWAKIEKAAKGLFIAGTAHAASRGLLFVDTKYEFGTDAKGNLILADEIHTPDSSRYWYAKSYAERFSEGKDPESLDKEFVRRWLMERGWMGEGEAPKFDDDFKVKIARRYISTYEELTGLPFTAKVGSARERIEKNLKKAKLL
ncbi:MAG TPA: phosphoribosylaminoimidazolesuccinocarboxamide synthase [bacterium]|nr:phosphoribosylaminoimidazolesuccinocarboxamide synthase [bacterium]